MAMTLTRARCTPICRAVNETGPVSMGVPRNFGSAPAGLSIRTRRQPARLVLASQGVSMATILTLARCMPIALLYGARRGDGQ